MIVPLYFLGYRDYVNAVTLFEEMLIGFSACTGNSIDDVRQIDVFRVNRFIRSACQLEIAQARNGMPQHAAVYLELQTRTDQAYVLYLNEINDRPVAERRPDYDRGRYVANMQTDDQGNTNAQLKNLEHSFDFLRGLVEVNYRFCVELASQRCVYKGVGWGYMLRLSWLRASEIRKVASLVFSMKSEFHLSNRVFIIRNLFIHTAIELSQPAELCFFYDA